MDYRPQKRETSRLLSSVDPVKVAAMQEEDVEKTATGRRMDRHRGKIQGIIW
ncbi:hypothetical protein ACNKHR_14015 [Shigella flexneri]